MSQTYPTAGGTGALPEQQLNALAGQVLDRLGAQRELPRVPVPNPWHIGPFFLNFPELVLAAVLLLCVALLAYGLLRMRRFGGDPGATPAGAAAPGASRGDANLQRAEAFAAVGRYMEAMHELLLQCVADVRQRGAGRLDESLTSREILHRAKLPPVGRDALAGIIARVEWTYFGHRPADAAHWQECRTQFAQLRGVLADRA